MNSGNLSCIFDNFSLLRPQTITLLFDFKKASASPAYPAGASGNQYGSVGKFHRVSSSIGSFKKIGINITIQHCDKKSISYCKQIRNPKCQFD